MKIRMAVLVSSAALMIVLISHAGRQMTARAEPANTRVPVLVELFTSEGCSSCPPADTVLSDLERTQPVAGAEVIALGQHVDYWNNGHWSDRFSSHAFSARQSDYAAYFYNSQVYTPQMIVDGQAEFVGSDRDRAVQAIARAARTPKADVEISIASASDSSATLQIHIDHLPTVPRGDKAQVLLAVTEDDLHSIVRGGENNGRSLTHNAVVRRLSVLGTAQTGSLFSAQPTVALDSVWNRAHLRAVVFVQTERGHQVIGVGTTPLGEVTTSTDK